MPYSYPGNIPKVAKNWTEGQQKKCVAAANAVLADDGSEQDAVFACIRAAGKTKHPGGEQSSGRLIQFVDLFDASKVLAGEEVLLVPVMPDGYVRGGVRRPPITAQEIQLLAVNFDQRATSGFYQTIVPLNKEHDEREGMIGSIAAVRAGDEGLYAKLDLTPAGQQLLAEKRFAYLSPEIRWVTEDVVTGESIGPTLVGAAVTNYPYFGDRTAMYSDRAVEHLASMPDMPVAEQRSWLIDIIDTLATRLRDLGWLISDLRYWQERSGGETGGAGDALGAAQDSLILALATLAQRIPAREAFRATLETVIQTREGADGLRYPRSAYLHGDADPSTWTFWYKVYNDQGQLAPDMDLLAGIYNSHLRQLSEADMADYCPEFYGVCEALGTTPDQLVGGFHMSETIEALSARLSAVEQERETFRRQLEERDQTIQRQGAEIAGLSRARLIDRFSRQAEGFNALGAPTADLAQNLAWLWEVDQTPDHTRFSFFESLLTATNKALAGSAAFSEVGTSRQPLPASAFDQIDAKVQALGASRGKGRVEAGTALYSELLEEVMRAEPDLFRSYRSSLVTD